LDTGERRFLERPRQKGGEQTGRNPVHRGKPGSKYHLVVDAIPPVIGPRGKPGPPRRRPAKLHADKAYDFSDLRRSLHIRGITPRIARRGIDSSERLGRHRWVAERTFAWLLGFRRLGVRYERRSDILQGMLHLACALVCMRFLSPVDR